MAEKYLNLEDRGLSNLVTDKIIKKILWPDCRLIKSSHGYWISYLDSNESEIVDKLFIKYEDHNNDFLSFDGILGGKWYV